MGERRGERWGRWVLTAILLLASAWVGAGCGSSGSTSAGSTSETPGLGDAQ